MKARRAGMRIAEICVITAAVIAFAAVQTPGPIQMMLFLWGVAALVVVGSALYLIISISDFLSRRGASTVRFPPGEVIFRQGDPGDFIYKVIDGEVEVVREEAGEEKVLARLGAGEFFGEAALLSDAPRNATIRTLSPVNAVKIGRGDFTTLYAHLPDFRRRVEAVSKERQA
jgi:CRP-like cAMP-binding protein